MENTPRELAWKGQPFKPWQRRLRARLIKLLGGFPRERGPLDVEELEREETPDYVRRKIVFTSEPYADVPCHLLIPRGIKRRVPGMVCLQGHSPGMHISIGVAHNDQEKELVQGDRDIAVQAARQGFVALALEQRCFGERGETIQQQRAEHPCQDAVMHSLLLGRTLIGERVWDVMRAIDLLQTVPEVNPRRIGCMGNSGGGTATFFSACVERRIKVAVVSCYFCTAAHSIMRIYHCADNYVPGMLKVAEMGELAGLVPPRKMLVVAGKEDSIFPFPGVQEAFATAKDIFTAAGCPENIELAVGEGGHRFYAQPSWPIIQRMIAGR
jgi:dienelactone hydrolase